MKFNFGKSFENLEKRIGETFEGKGFEKKPKTQDEEAEAVMTKDQKMQSESRAEGYGLGKEAARNKVREGYQERVDFHEAVDAQKELSESIAKKNGYREVGLFENNRAWAYSEGGVYLIDKSGKKISGPFVEGGGRFLENRTIVQKEHGKHYVIDSDGKIVAGPFADGGPYHESPAGVIAPVVVEKGGHERYIDRNGNFVPVSETIDISAKEHHKAEAVMTEEQKMQSEAHAEGYGLGEKEGSALGKKEGEELWKEYRTKDKK